MRIKAQVVVAAALVVAGPVAAQEMPSLVAAYAQQLAAQCGPAPQGASVPNIVERADLNGDKLDDWIVDAGRYPCPGRPALAATAGAQVTVFRGVQPGLAVPAFQRAAFGSRLQRAADGTPMLSLTLGGADCGGAKPEDRCERRVVWRAAEGRFDAMAPPRPVTAAR